MPKLHQGLKLLSETYSDSIALLDFSGSLERMLSNHSQSMFEYLAPRRGGGGAQGHGGAPHPPQPQNHGKPQNDGYKEMVY